MQTPDSQKIIARYFEALYRLKADKVLRGKQTFTARFGINRWNMNTLEKNHESDMFQTAWLTYLVEHYGVSPAWLLTGKGAFYQKGKEPQPTLHFTNSKRGE